MARFLLALFVCLGAMSAMSRTTAAAQEDAGIVPCDDPPLRGPKEVFPTVGAVGVTVDAPLRMRYSEDYFVPGVGPGDDPTMLMNVQRCPSVSTVCDMASCDDEGVFVPGRVQVVGDELVYFPDTPWQPSTAYSGIARGLDVDLPFRFCTGSSSDDLAPELGPLGEVTSDVVEPRCDDPDGGFRIAVFFEPATDTGPPGSIEYLLFQTRGPGIESPVLRSRVRNLTSEQVIMAFVLPPDEATSPICVRVAAVDGVGNLDFNDADESGDTCVDPVQGNFYYGLCTVRQKAADGNEGLWFGGWFAGLVLFAGLLDLRRRRRTAETNS